MPESIKHQVQQKIQEYRKRRKLTLKQLGDRAGCTQSYISQLEKGLTVPSLSMLGKLARALEVNVIDLFGEQPPNGDQTWHLKRDGRKSITYPDGKVTSQILSTRISQKKIEPLISVIEPGGSSDAVEEMAHPKGTEEFALIMEGEVEFQINGQISVLQEGDSVDFDGSLPHRWENKSARAAKVLFVFSPPIW